MQMIQGLISPKKAQKLQKRSEFWGKKVKILILGYFGTF